MLQKERVYHQNCGSLSKVRFRGDYDRIYLMMKIPRRLGARARVGLVP
jgi:hypothetical protein